MRSVREIFAKAVPGHLDGHLRIHALLQPAAHIAGERAHGVAFAEDLQRHALLELRERARILQHADVRVTQHVDEAG
jgi:hypothetical protein